MEATSFVHVVPNFLDEKTSHDLAHNLNLHLIEGELVRLVSDYLIEVTGRLHTGVKVLSYKFPTQTDEERGGWFVRPGDVVGARIGVLVMLSDVAKGGGTLFTVQDIKVPTQIGTAVIFPTNWAFNYESYHPKVGTKHFLQVYLTFDKVHQQ